MNNDRLRSVHSESIARTTTAQERRDIRRLLRGSIYEGMVDMEALNNLEYSAQQVIEFCLDLGELMLISGADARSVEVAIVAVAGVWNLGSVELDFPSASILMIYSPPFERSESGLRVVRTESPNLHRLNEIYSVVDDIVSTKIDMTEAAARLSKIIQEKPRWNAWVTSIAMGILGITVGLQAGGSWKCGFYAILLMMLITWVNTGLSKWNLPTFYSTGIKSFIATLVGSLCIAGNYLTSAEAASMVAACMVLILPHPSIVSFAQDAISGFRSIAVVRGIGIGLIIMGLIFGISAGFSISSFVHRIVAPETIHLTGLNLSLALLATVVAALANGFAQGAPPRTLPIIGLIALITQLAQQVFIHGRMGLELSPMLAGVVLGGLGTWIAAQSRISVASLVVPAFCGALLPSLLVAQRLLQIISGEKGAAIGFTLAILSTMAIGAGLVLGNILVSGEARKAAEKIRVRSKNLNTAPRMVTDKTEITSEFPVIDASIAP